ncbi:TPA: hypothetical protein ACH3X1_001023 [Trebouxia sp. C0004]
MPQARYDTQALSRLTSKDNKDLSQDKLTALAATTLKKPGLKRPTVTSILSKRDKWLNISDSAASSKVKHRGPKHANLETALIEWLSQLRAKNALTTDSLVTEKAKALAEKLDITDFQFSTNRQQQQSITSYFMQ